MKKRQKCFVSYICEIFFAHSMYVLRVFKDGRKRYDTYRRMVISTLQRGKEVAAADDLTEVLEEVE